MPDISLRFHHDLLVLTAPLDEALARQGVDVPRDGELVALLEPESVHEALRMELMAGAQCAVTQTASLAPARLARVGMEGRGPDVVREALSVMRELAPQHVLVEIGPCGLPLDGSSKASLNENRAQYARAARLLSSAGADAAGVQAGVGPVDAVFLNGFATCDDLKCALMGVRQVYDSPVFASVDVRVDGTLASGRGTLEDALAVMGDLGASVAGFATGAGSDAACELARRAAAVDGAAAELPLLVQLSVARCDAKQGGPTEENPYYCPDTMVDAALRLRAEGVQFLRATGAATPAYTGVLVAATLGAGVAGARATAAREIADAESAEGVAASGSMAGNAGASASGTSDVAVGAAVPNAAGLDSLAASLRARVADALANSSVPAESEGDPR